MIIRSNYNGRGYEANETGGVYVIAHHDLKQVAITEHFEYEFKVIMMTPPNCVVECRMTAVDYEKREYHVTEVGETCAASLYGIDAASYAAVTAYNRAFDKAVISILNFDEEVYSSSELSERETAKMTKRAKKAEKTKAASEEKVEENTMPEEPDSVEPEEGSEPVIEIQEEIEPIKDEEKILIGTCIGKTFKDVKADEVRFNQLLDWVELKKPTYPFEDRQKQALYLLKLALERHESEGAA